MKIHWTNFITYCLIWLVLFSVLRYLGVGDIGVFGCAIIYAMIYPQQIWFEIDPKKEDKKDE